MWNTMTELNTAFAKAFIVAAGTVSVACFGIAYYTYKQEQKQQYIFRVVIEDGSELIVIAHNENEAIAFVIEAKYIPKRVLELGAANEGFTPGIQ